MVICVHVRALYTQTLVVTIKTGGVYTYDRDDVPTFSPTVTLAPSNQPSSVPTSPSGRPSQAPITSSPTPVPSTPSSFPTSLPTIPYYIVPGNSDETGDLTSKAVFIALMVLVGVVVVTIAVGVLRRVCQHSWRRRNAAEVANEGGGAVHAVAQWASRDGGESTIGTEIIMSEECDSVVIELVAVATPLGDATVA